MAEKETKLQQKLIVKKSDAQVAIAITFALPSIATTQIKLLAKKNNIIGEVFLKVINIIFCFAGLLQKEIISIFYNKFKPINLYQLYYIRGFYFNIMQNYDWMGIRDKILKLRKASKTYKDFSKSFYEIWANVFHNYMTIFIFFFGKKALNLHIALAHFFSSIYKLWIVYNRQEVVLLIAINIHIFIIA